MCLVKVVIKICLLLVVWMCVLESRLFIWVVIGCILMIGFNKLVGCIICFVILLFDLVSLYLFGVVDIKMVCGVNVLNLLNLSGWLFKVEGRWKLNFISVFFCEWLFLNIVLICGMVMCDLLMISKLLWGK